MNRNSWRLEGHLLTKVKNWVSPLNKDLRLAGRVACWLAGWLAGELPTSNQAKKPGGSA